MENSLPKGWKALSLEDITSYIIGGDWGIDVKEDGFEKVHVIRGTDYKAWDSIRAKNSAVRYVKASSVEKRELTEGDMVLEVSGGGPDQPVGRVIIIDTRALESIDGKLGFSNFFRLIRIAKPLNPFFIKYYLDYAYSIGEFNEMQSHTTNLRNLRVNEFLSKTLIPIPPLPEQQRIVAKLDELMAKIDRSRARLERVPQILKRFRQSVLSAAVSGKLTEEWRERNGIVDRWEETTLGESLELLDQGWSPKCENFPSKSEEIWGVIKTTAVQHMEFFPEENKQLPKTLLPEPQFEVRIDDILITRAGPRVRVGVCCHVKKTRTRLMICDKVYRMRTRRHIALPGFIELLLNTYDRLEEIEGMKTGISDSGVNLTQAKIKAIIFSIPKINEQEEILRLTSKLFAVADKIEARYKKAKAQLDKLPQSLLAKAFRGELVPQDEKDEPASVLLERIHQGNPAKPGKARKPRGYKMGVEPLSIAAEQ